MNTLTLNTLTAKDLQNAGTNNSEFKVCPAGVHNAKIISFTEEDTYNYVSVEIDSVKYNFFYNYTLRDSDQLDANLINWIIKLATIPVTDNTHLLEITNSAIGKTYEIETYVYTPKTGKNAGKEQHAIRFSTAPKLVEVEIEAEDLSLEDFPF